MANEEHLAKLKEGVDAWNRWQKESPDDCYVAVPMTGQEGFGFSVNVRGAGL